jgi:hypothetical protein
LLGQNRSEHRSDQLPASNTPLTPWRAYWE